MDAKPDGEPKSASRTAAQAFEEPEWQDSLSCHPLRIAVKFHQMRHSLIKATRFDSAIAAVDAKPVFEPE